MQQMALLIPLNALYLDDQTYTVQLCLILYLNFSTLFFFSVLFYLSTSSQIQPFLTIQREATLNFLGWPGTVL